jgi:hypothetical protein
LSDQLSALQQGRPSEAGPLAGYVEDARSRVTSLADRLESGGAAGLVEDVTAFARRRPGMFVAGAVVAGFLLGRLVRGGVASNSDEGNAPTDGARSSHGAQGALPPPSAMRRGEAERAVGERAELGT